MRLLYARVGRTFCRNCGREVVRETAEVVARQLGALPAGHAPAASASICRSSTSSASSADAPEVDELSERRRADETRGGTIRRSRDAGAATRESARREARQRCRRGAIASAAPRRASARLLVDGRAVTFDDVDPRAAARTVDAAGRRRSPAARTATICASG